MEKEDAYFAVIVMFNLPIIDNLGERLKKIGNLYYLLRSLTKTNLLWAHSSMIFGHSKEEYRFSFVNKSQINYPLFS